MTDVTRILSQIEAGDPRAAEELLPLVYEELRKLAAARLAKEKSGHTLQATALVHEAYLRLLGPDDGQAWSSRAHFFGAAAEAMRRILIDHARKKMATRREGDRARVDLEDADVAAFRARQLVELDDALQDLEHQDALAAQIVKIRYFAGLTMQQVAECLEIPLRTAERNWKYAKTYLYSAMNEAEN